MPRYNQVIFKIHFAKIFADRYNSALMVVGREVIYCGAQLVWVNPPVNPKSANFRIVSHYGSKDWSPFGTLEEMKTRAATLPERPEGYFKIVEG